MAFSETIKKEVMQKAGYCCCVCKKASVSVEVHHIKPEAQGGDDSIENAAPLCPTCHSDYGGNPEKRTRIKQMRDWLYETTARMYESNITSPEQLCEIHDLLQCIDVKQDSIIQKQDKHDTDLKNLKIRLKAISDKAIDNMTTVTSDVTTSAVLGAAGMVLGGNMKCNRCGNMVDFMYANCPYCGQYMG